MNRLRSRRERVLSSMASTPGRRRLLWVGAGVLACALAAGLFTSGRSQTDLLPLPPSPQALASAAPVQAQQRPWSPGTWYRYTLVSSQSVTVSSNQANAKLPPPMRFDLKGEWRVGLCAASAEAMESRISFTPSDFSVNMDGEQPLAPEMRRDLLEGLTTPFFITLDSAGAVRRIHFEQAVDALVQGLLRSVVAASQVVLPSAASASWETSEEDSSGRYVASYRLDSPLHIEKRKLRYSHLVQDEGLQPVENNFKVEVNAHTTLTLAREDLWLESLQAEDTMAIDSGPEMPTPSTHTQVELRLVERGSDRSLLEAFADHRSALLSLPMASPQLAKPQDPKEHHRQVLAGRTLSDFIKLLRALPQEKKARGDAIHDLLEGLVALFVLEPAKAAEVPGLLRTGLSPDATSTIMGALSAATTPEALHALTRIMADTRLTPEVREDAAEAMNGAEAPTQESISSLWKLARGSEEALRGTAILALGSAAMHLQTADAGAADALVDELTRALAAAQGEKAQDLWLGALGNARNPRALASIQPFLTVTSPEMRAAATESLRFMPAPQADRLLSERLVSDAAPRVRSAAVFAAGFRPLDPLLPALERALRSDPEAMVRMAVVHLLKENASASPKARLLLTWSSTEDAAASVRGEAAKALQRPQAPEAGPPR